MGVNSNDDVNDLKAEIVRLHEKLNVMRALLWEWNVTSDNVWEYYRLKKVGETEEDYSFLDENYGEPDMPLFDEE